MPVPPLPPVGLGPEAQIAGVGPLGPEATLAPATPASGGFGSLLIDQVQNLNGVQAQADALQQAMAAGQDVDVTQVVVAAERAQLSKQLATQMRNKLVDAYNELMRTQM